MKTIRIVKHHASEGFWAKTVNAEFFTFMEKDGLQFAYTERNYYLDTREDKVRFETMAVGQASYKHLYDLYVQVNSNHWHHVGICTDDTLGASIADAVVRTKNIETTKEDSISQIEKSLAEY